MTPPPYMHILAALAVSLGAGLALAPREVTVVSFGAANAACQRWGDACVICQRGEGGSAKCSTPGIACVAGPVVCEAGK